MTFPFARLFRSVVRLDQSGDAPPWPADVFDPDSGTWQRIGIVGAQGPAGAAGPPGAMGPAGPSYAPLCTGDAGPAMIGTGDGQPVLVRIL